MEISIESCRICLRNPFCVGENERESWKSVLLDDVDLDQISYAEKYNVCTGIKISKSSKLGRKICMKCLPFLRKMYTFLKICFKSEKILQKHIDKEFEIKIEPKTEQVWDNDYLENYSPHPIKIESFEIEIPNKKSNRKEFFNVIELPSIGQNENCIKEKEETINITNALQTFRVKEEESYICEICGNIYKKRYLLEKHVTTHSNKKKYECEICGKAFLHQQYLSAHVRRHSGVKKFNCSFCSRKFYTKGKLTEHERVHRGERIHKCKYCDSSFFYGHNLKRHQLCHLGLKPYLCKHCHKTFRTKSNLDQHFKTDVHKDVSTRIYSILSQ